MDVTDKELAAQPAGSEDDSRMDKGWTTGLNAASIEGLASIGEQMSNLYETEVKSHVKFRLKMGGLLNEAREHFPGDKEFGQWRMAWRDEHAPGMAPNTMSVMQHMAREFKNSAAFLEKAGWSVGQELLSAPPVVWGKVESMLEAGEKPTVQDVREEKKVAASTPQTSEDSEPEQVLVPDEDKRAKVIIRNENIKVRIELLDEDKKMHQFTKAWALIRLPAPVDDEYRYIVDMVFEVYLESWADDAEVCDALNAAWDYIKEQGA